MFCDKTNIRRGKSAYKVRSDYSSLSPLIPEAEFNEFDPRYLEILTSVSRFSQLEPFINGLNSLNSASR